MPSLPEFLIVRPAVVGVHSSLSWKTGIERRMKPHNLRGHRVSRLLCHLDTLVHGTKQDASKWGKIKLYNWLNTTLRAVIAGAFKYWNANLAKASLLINVRWPATWAGPPNKHSCTIEEGKVPVGHIKNMLGTSLWVILPQAVTNPFTGFLLLKDLGTFGGYAGGWGALTWTSREFDFG